MVLAASGRAGPGSEVPPPRNPRGPRSRVASATTDPARPTVAPTTALPGAGLRLAHDLLRLRQTARAVPETGRLPALLEPPDPDAGSALLPLRVERGRRHRPARPCPGMLRAVSPGAAGGGRGAKCVDLQRSGAAFPAAGQARPSERAVRAARRAASRRSPALRLPPRVRPNRAGPFPSVARPPQGIPTGTRTGPHGRTPAGDASGPQPLEASFGWHHPTQTAECP